MNKTFNTIANSNGLVFKPYFYLENDELKYTNIFVILIQKMFGFFDASKFDANRIIDKISEDNQPVLKISLKKIKKAKESLEVFKESLDNHTVTDIRYVGHSRETVDVKKFDVASLKEILKDLNYKIQINHLPAVIGTKVSPPASPKETQGKMNFVFTEPVFVEREQFGEDSDEFTRTVIREVLEAAGQTPADVDVDFIATTPRVLAKFLKERGDMIDFRTRQYFE